MIPVIGNAGRSPLERKEVVRMRRITLVLTVLLVVAAMMVVMAAPAMAQEQKEEAKMEEKGKAKDKDKDKEKDLPKSGGIPIEASLLGLGALLVGGGLLAFRIVRQEQS